ncbi:unnamed protein product [Symbiodinium natans]|uniref:ubiquitinyl hydrolase 1 n=1 Tax=Symbiodinium natans TaxID=878477 RepID=A0A812RIB8_9DINO|nr:unnamed protein product [Symbiodinium natans]
MRALTLAGCLGEWTGYAAILGAGLSSKTKDSAKAAQFLERAIRNFTTEMKALSAIAQGENEQSITLPKRFVFRQIDCRIQALADRIRTCEKLRKKSPLSLDLASVDDLSADSQAAFGQRAFLLGDAYAWALFSTTLVVQGQQPTVDDFIPYLYGRGLCAWMRHMDSHFCLDEAIDVVVPDRAFYLVETQRERLCGLHVVNNMLGVVLYAREDFDQIAEDFAARNGIDRKCFCESDGYYSVEVLKEALGQRALDLDDLSSASCSVFARADEFVIFLLVATGALLVPKHECKWEAGRGSA